MIRFDFFCPNRTQTWGLINILRPQLWSPLWCAAETRCKTSSAAVTAGAWSGSSLAGTPFPRRRLSLLNICWRTCPDQSQNPSDTLLTPTRYSYLCHTVWCHLFYYSVEMWFSFYSFTWMFEIHRSEWCIKSMILFCLLCSTQILAWQFVQGFVAAKFVWKSASAVQYATYTWKLEKSIANSLMMDLVKWLFCTVFGLFKNENDL